MVLTEEQMENIYRNATYNLNILAVEIAHDSLLPKIKYSISLKGIEQLMECRAA